MLAGLVLSTMALAGAPIARSAGAAMAARAERRDSMDFGGTVRGLKSAGVSRIAAASM